jgi:hypothetical protein
VTAFVGTVTMVTLVKNVTCVYIVASYLGAVVTVVIIVTMVTIAANVISIYWLWSCSADIS